MPRTQTERLWIGGGAVLALIVTVIGYFFLIGPQRSKTADVQGQVADAQLQAGTLQSRIASLTSQQKKIGTYRAALAAAQAALPTAGDTSASPAFLRSLQSIAGRTSTSVSSLTVGDPAPIAATAPVATTSSASPSTTAPAATTASPVSSLYSVAITASVSGTAPHLVGFMSAIQHQQSRAVLVDAMSLDSTPTTGHGSSPFTLSLTMTAFVRPSVTAATSTTGATAAVPAAVPSTTSTP